MNVGSLLQDTKDEKKTKKSSKEMAPPKTMAPKGNKPIASMPHPSPLDQVGSPQSGPGKTFENTCKRWFLLTTYWSWTNYHQF